MAKVEPRNPEEMDQLLEDFSNWLSRDPSGAVIAGVIEQDTTGASVRVDMGMANVDVRHLLVAAYALLGKAEERLLTSPIDETTLQVLGAVQRAIHALGGSRGDLN